MADSVYIAYTSTAFAATAGAKTIIKIITGSTFQVQIHEMKVSTDGVTASAVPATLEWGTSDETTAGTSTTTITPVQIKGRTQAHGCTIGSNFSAEGTTYTVHDGIYLPQFMGQLIIQNPLGFENQSPSDAADSFFLRINVTANVNVRASIKFSKN